MGRGKLVRRATLLVIFASSAVLVSGCAASEPPGYSGEPTVAGQALVVDSAAGSDVRAWPEGDLLIVTTTGSGSCPSVPVIDGIDEESRVVSLMTSVPNSQGVGTADSVPRTFELDAGRDLSEYTVQVVAD